MNQYWYTIINRSLRFILGFTVSLKGSYHRQGDGIGMVWLTSLKESGSQNCWYWLYCFSPKFICWSPKPQSIRMWLYLEIGSSEIIKVKWGHWSGFQCSITNVLGLSGGSVVKNLFASTGDAHSILVLGRSPGEGNGNLLPYSCQENPMDRGAYRATVTKL